ncbi:hypothetical protein ScPMuIL_010100 [Solemya velum]
MACKLRLAWLLFVTYVCVYQTYGSPVSEGGLDDGPASRLFGGSIFHSFADMTRFMRTWLKQLQPQISTPVTDDTHSQVENTEHQHVAKREVPPLLSEEYEKAYLRSAVIQDLKQFYSYNENTTTNTTALNRLSDILAEKKKLLQNMTYSQLMKTYNVVHDAVAAGGKGGARPLKQASDLCCPLG